MVLDLITPEVIKWADQVFACGPTAMYRDMASRKKELGLTAKSVQVSLEARMGCGRGVCYGCTVRTQTGLKQVCKDGPVFELDDIIWDELSPKL
jgi:dihydroorotate dehydrogenase electron transfer subunit